MAFDLKADTREIGDSHDNRMSSEMCEPEPHAPYSP